MAVKMRARRSHNDGPRPDPKQHLELERHQQHTHTHRRMKNDSKSIRRHSISVFRLHLIRDAIMQCEMRIKSESDL